MANTNTNANLLKFLLLFMGYSSFLFKAQTR